MSKIMLILSVFSIYYLVKLVKIYSFSILGLPVLLILVNHIFIKIIIRTI